MKEAKSVFYYVMDYMVKDATAIEISAVFIYEARKTTLNSQTVARQASRFLTRIINNISTKSEITVTMAIAA
jgi:hypothetical protein